VLAAVIEVGYAALKSDGSFILPGWAKFVVKTTKARKAGKGINPFTKEPCMIKAKPAGKTVRARAVKAVKTVV
jgi:nucleoid DNA-binding protein